MSSGWISLSCFVVIIAQFVGCVVASVQFTDPKPWTDKQYVVNKIFPQSIIEVTPSALSTDAKPSIQQLAQYRNLLGAHHLAPVYEQSGSQLYAQTPQYPQTAYLMNVNPADQRAYVVSGTPTHIVSPTSATTEQISSTDINAAAGSVISHNSGTAIVGGPSDGVIGVDGQILGSTQDTAVVESAGQLGPTLLQAHFPVAYQDDGRVVYSPQQMLVSPSALRYQYAYPVADTSSGYQFSFDQYGQPVVAREPKQNQQLIGGLYSVNA